MGLDEEIALGDDLLAQLLHGIVRLGSVPLHKVHFPEGASPDDLDKLEVIETDFLVGPEEVLARLNLALFVGLLIVIFVDCLTQDRIALLSIRLSWYVYLIKVMRETGG